MHVHAAIVHLAPILGAEKSRTAFYAAGGVLVVWALLVSLGLGLRRRDFPRTAALQRLVMIVSAVLVLAVVSTAVLTSGGSTKAETSHAASPPPAQTTAAAGAPQGGAASRLSEAADPSGQLRFTSPRLTAKAGRVSVDFADSSPLAHNFTLAQGATVLGATPTFQGGSKTLTVELKPGTYKFYCTVPGHREAGMEGTLVVS